uniref:Uncharacterized protein n=1 Tax=Caenorhabditis japonica TaxID=281687 RepID=A0A8R1IYX6_CAEJA
MAKAPTIKNSVLFSQKVAPRIPKRPVRMELTSSDAISYTARTNIILRKKAVIYGGAQNYRRDNTQPGDRSSRGYFIKLEVRLNSESLQDQAVKTSSVDYQKEPATKRFIPLTVSRRESTDDRKQRPWEDCSCVSSDKRWYVWNCFLFDH